MAALMDPQRVWRGPFSSWQQAVDQAFNPNLTWSERAWTSRQEEFLHVAGVDAKNPPRPSTLPMAAGLLNARRIVDYGGGAGWVFALLKKSCPNLKLTSYTVAELPDVVQAFNQLASADPRLTYVTFQDISLLPGADLLYANASLHYGETERPFLHAAVALGPVPHITLDGFLANPEREFYLVQHVYGHDIPVHIPRLSDSLNALRQTGYRVTSCLPQLAPAGGVYRYDLPLGHFGAPYTETRRYFITASG
jgi:putative methyltransferase (TIGR04325 family)